MVCMCVKRDAKEAESRAGRGERCRPRIRLRGDSVWMAVVLGTALHLQALLHAVASSQAVFDRWERHGKRRSVRLQLSGAAFCLARDRVYRVSPALVRQLALTRPTARVVPQRPHATALISGQPWRRWRRSTLPSSRFVGIPALGTQPGARRPAPAL